MAESTYGIGSVADQRYYHFILWKTKRDLSLPALWRRIGDVVIRLAHSGRATHIIRFSIKS